jgi:glyoxylase-like metal-dependent hydrolase (beta-lactamase superfamily II)
VRVVSLHPDVILLTSAIWQTNCTIVRSGEECFAIDSPILPQELEVLPSVLEQAGIEGGVAGHKPAGRSGDSRGRRVSPDFGRAPRHFKSKLSGLLATHGDWDHLLGRLAFPQASLGCAHSTVARLGDAPGEPQRELRAFDEEHYIERPQPLSLGSLQDLPVPGHCGIGEREIELHRAEGHTADGMAVWIPWAAVLVAGDYLSAVEIPFFGEGNGALDAYRATLQRLRPLVRRAQHVVPGHGPVLDSHRALKVLEEDLAYLESLQQLGADAQLPRGRRTRAQRRMHAENLAAKSLT